LVHYSYNLKYHDRNADKRNDSAFSASNINIGGTGAAIKYEAANCPMKGKG